MSFPYGDLTAKQLMKNGYWLILKLWQPLSSDCYNFKEIEQVFGSWDNYIQHVSHEFPKIKANTNLIELESLIERSNLKMDRVLGFIEENDIKNWIHHKLIPRSRKSGKIGLFSETLIPLLIRIKILIFLEFGPKQIHKLMSISGKYNKLIRTTCRVCSCILEGYTANSTAICFGCAK